MMPFVGIALLVGSISGSLNGGVAARTVDALEQRWYALEHTWHEACVTDDHLLRAEAEHDMRELLGAVHVLNTIVESLPMPTLAEQPHEHARTLRDNGKALMWEGCMNTVCGIALQTAVEGHVTGDIGSLLRAIAIIWKMFGVAQIGIGSIKLLGSVFALPRASMAARLAELEEEIELFMARECIPL